MLMNPKVPNLVLPIYDVVFYWAAVIQWLLTVIAKLWTAVSEMTNYKQPAIQVWPEAALIHTCMIIASIGNLPTAD